MKEWSELEERYQEMKVKDPKAAEDFRKKMSAVSTFLYVLSIFKLIFFLPVMLIFACHF